ncbi:hypothetical protein GCM10022220_47190 [Actinocatenispora rupis]|uniref:Uncharacterized protein n=1 Tax=Actinocatenispora rupis TaxID=519421 RepID=A0A8J3J1I9_9ACTN|nr:hypothetical protein Aru02nite_33920 [Actinocatenispora rupis]
MTLLATEGDRKSDNHLHRVVLPDEMGKGREVRRLRRVAPRRPVPWDGRHGRGEQTVRIAARHPDPDGTDIHPEPYAPAETGLIRPAHVAVATRSSTAVSSTGA